MPSAPKVRAQRRIQYAALPYRQRQDGEVQIRLITSRETRRWVIPKGWPMKGLSPAKAAAREAYEEAGLLGSISTEPLGMYSYDKRLTLQTVPCDVIVFPMKVKRYMKNWPERAERFGFWFSIESAAAAVQEEELRQIILAFGAMMADRFAKKRSRAPVSTEAEDASEDAEGAAADRARKALAAKTKAAKDKAARDKAAKAKAAKAAKDKAAKEKVAADAGPMSDGLGTSAKGKVTGGKATKAKATKAKPVKAKVAKAKTVYSDVVPNVQDAATPVVTPAKAKAKPAKPKAAKSAGAKPKAAKAKAAQAASMTEVPAFDGSAPSPATAKARASKASSSKAGSTKPRVAKAKAEAEAVASAAKPKAAKRKAAPKAKGGPKPKGPAAKTKSAAAKRAKGKTGLVPGTVASAAAKGKDAPAEVPAGWALKLPPSTTRH